MPQADESVVGGSLRQFQLPITIKDVAVMSGSENFEVESHFPRNNHRIKMQPYRDVLLCDAQIDDEFSAEDLQSIRDEIRQRYSPSIDVIFIRSGSYSASAEAQSILSGNIKEFRNFVYVVNTPRKKASAEFAASSYMKPYNTQVASSVEEAYSLLHSER